MSLRWGVCLLAMCCTGCLVSNSLPVIRRVEPATGSVYYLYVPSYYTDQQEWALVVSCHGTPFWDVAERQAAEWSGLAERMGFLVAAPELEGTRGDFLPPPAGQIRRQEADERRILAVVKCVKAAYTVPDDRVFLTGWSAGSFAVLHTGLGHPEVFRALAIRQGNFDPRFIEPLVPVMDRHQPILISWGNVDVLQSQARSCYDWLKAQGMSVEMRETTGGHRRHPEVAFDFFLRCVREVPWVLLHAEPADDDPMAVRFRLTSSPPAMRYAWSFGDGETSTTAAPTHVYAEPGTYEVNVQVRHPGRQTSLRTVNVSVPKRWVGAAD